MSQERRTFRRLWQCSRADTLSAFRVVGQEIRLKCRRFASTGLTQADACELAGRIKEQRDLIRLISGRRNVRLVGKLVRLNSKLRRRLIGIAESAGLDTTVLIFK